MKKTGLRQKLLKIGGIIAGVYLISKALQANEENVIDGECKEIDDSSKEEKEKAEA